MTDIRIIGGSYAEALGHYCRGGDPFCRECLDPDHSSECEGWAILHTDESDAPTHCYQCSALLHHRLTGDGLDYVREALELGGGDADVLDVWRVAYIDNQW